MRNKLIILLKLLLIQLTSSAIAETETDSFRVCADPRNLPFSHRDQTGFENKLAELWADELGREVHFTWFPQRRGFIRNTLKSQDPLTGEYKCDVVMGVADGYERLLTTTPYYRSTYALVYVKGRGLDDVKTGQDFANLKPERKQPLRVGAFTPTPGTQWLARYGMTEQTVAYVAMSGDPEAYPGEIIEKSLLDGELDAVVIWGPIAGYFARQADDQELAVIPLESEPGIQFDFAIAAGVRFGDSEGKARLENLIQETATEIEALLASYHVPLIKR